MHRVSAPSRAKTPAYAFALVAACLIAACSSAKSRAEGDAGQNPDVATAIASLAGGQWSAALTSCLEAEMTNPGDCDAKYCELVARAMLVVDEINDFLLPRYRRPLTPMPGDAANLKTTNMLLDAATQAAEQVTSRQCEFTLPTLPFRIGDAADPVVRAEIRGIWTTRDAHFLAALFYSISYGLQAEFNAQPVPPPPAGDTVPALPPMLASMQEHLLAQQQLLFSQPADPTTLRGGWLDRNANGTPDSPDELLLDIFVPGTDKRVLDYSDAEFVKGEALPAGVLTATADLPPAKCGYQKFHVDTVASGSNVAATDGMTFSPDGTQIAIPLQVSGKSEIHVANADGTSPACITCGQPGNNDGVRWRPTGDALIFISDRDHPYATGNAGGGFGQELYAMLPDGSQPTRLTQSGAWATNYHVNWSPDGMHLVWGSTQAYAWDVMVADFVSDASGMRLEATRRLVHDTTWWETHGFTADNKYVITTNTRAGFQTTDLYAIDISNPTNRIRLTTAIPWDEHAHLSPDGREISWISGRFHPASVLRLNGGSLAPTLDFLWIVPGIFFEFLNPPAGYTTELTLMDADGNNVHALTDDQMVIADNQWSFDGTKIIFRETSSTGQGTKLRVLTFDDCQ